MSQRTPKPDDLLAAGRDAEFEEPAMHGLAGGVMAPARLAHPRGLYLLFVTKMWERFSYYGMRAFLMLYMTTAVFQGGMGWTIEKAASLYGWYTGLCYLTPLAGGYLADRFLGTHYSMLIGGAIIAAGHFCLAFETLTSFYAGLALVIVGTGFFKPCVSVMVSQLYPQRDPRRDSAFTIFYMGINLGAFMGPLICGGLRLGRKTGEVFGWGWAFGAAGVGMVLGLIAYLIGRPFLLKGIGLPSRQTAHSARNPGQSDGPLTREEKHAVAVIFIMSFFVIFFWTAFEQAGSSMNLFAEHRTDRSLGTGLATTLYRAGTEANYPAPWWLFALIGAGLFLLWATIGRLTDKTRPTAGPGLVILRILGLAVGPALLLFGLLKPIEVIKFAFFPDDFIERAQYPADWFQSVNPFFIIVLAPIFASIWFRLGQRGREPSTPVKFSVGLLLVGVGFVCMVLGARQSVGPDGTIVHVSALWLLGAYFIHTVAELCLSPVGLSMVNKLAPLKFVSLLMGVWFLANFAANKLAGSLAGIVEKVERGEVFTVLGGQADFYLMFVIAPIVAGFILLAIAPVLKRMMHGRT